MSDPSRCTVCGCPRVREDGGTFGACTLVPGRDGKGGCPDPLHDCRAEEARRRELVVRGAIEAARGYMATFLTEERALYPRDLTSAEADALQTLRDALAVERRTRGGAR